MPFIGLHYNGEKRLFNISNISAIAERTDKDCAVYVVGDPDPVRVDETYEEIIELLKNGGQHE